MLLLIVGEAAATAKQSNTATRMDSVKRVLDAARILLKRSIFVEYNERNDFFFLCFSRTGKNHFLSNLVERVQHKNERADFR